MSGIIPTMTTAEISAKYPEANRDRRKTISCGLSCATCAYAVCGNDYHKQEDPDKLFCAERSEKA